MQIKEVIQHLETLAPTNYAEDFDNVGLLVGDKNTTVTGILVTLDTLEIIIDEAIEKDCNLIVSFHPIVFKGIKKFNGTNYVERVVMKAIKHDIAIFAIHTALDNALHGVNDMICEQLGLLNRQVLIPQSGNIKKLVTFAPNKEADSLRSKLFDAGAGTIGNYDHCSFSSDGIGTFRASENANPSIGEIGKTHYESETQIQITYPKHNESKILKALIDNHSYEEVAYEITTLENRNQHIGMGMIGELPEEMNEIAFLKHIKEVFKTGCVRHSTLLDKPIRKVAVLGGSGSFAIKNAQNAGADVFITADLKYHQFYEAENKLILADIGHYESEQYTKNLIVSYLRKKISNFAIILSDKNTNPIQYI
ncbi:Nif3-like dinuclear metal center hexameric protein [Aquimarina sp. BL5]|uniref:Nif3-like dinuclear metal center hexameric protein n=1 Tax=Aquimarina sp. BL5 TaxID=1714860 RepID=UPI000E495FA5|nr:Nif3-like dinuclear metal center hexameric protein [Aquimarina sp. BL5]AXT53118.1 Nif3-like dinuclear metal center hexameric protein [Aquimarina sp. BL5]RKN03694.1 Nif3-like dinuclear metal center hexameric protein [Aquimarina sp. BL5]